MQMILHRHAGGRPFGEIDNRVLHVFPAKPDAQVFHQSSPSDYSGVGEAVPKVIVDHGLVSECVNSVSTWSCSSKVVQTNGDFGEKAVTSSLLLCTVSN